MDSRTASTRTSVTVHSSGSRPFRLQSALPCLFFPARLSAKCAWAPTIPSRPVYSIYGNGLLGLLYGVSVGFRTNMSATALPCPCTFLLLTSLAVHLANTYARTVVADVAATMAEYACPWLVSRAGWRVVRRVKSCVGLLRGHTRQFCAVASTKFLNDGMHHFDNSIVPPPPSTPHPPPPTLAPLIDIGSQPDSQSTSTTASTPTTRPPPHNALCPCSHVQAMRSAHLLDGAVSS